MNERLIEKENKQFMIHQLLKNHPTVISIGANIPGHDKNISEAHLLMRLFIHVVKDTITTTSIETFSSSDGPYALLTTLHTNVNELKQRLISIEDSHPLGRLIDLDLYQHGMQSSISRTEINFPSRKCMICNDDFNVCRRLQRHSVAELLTHIKDEVEHYLETVIGVMIEDSMTAELDLEHKFGLVTKKSQGSHHDMDYQLMIEARDVLIPHFIKIFMLGYHATSIKNLLSAARPLGIEAEHQMLQSTHGVNCYKGLIFVLGLILLSTGYVMSHGEPFETIFDHIRVMSKPLLHELHQGHDTHGKQMFKTYGSLGVRGEAHMGFPSVIHALSILNHENMSDGLIRHVLKEIALKTDDTVLLHRSGSIEQAQFFKDMLFHSNVKDEEVAQKLTSYAISKSISLGGSADLLIGSLFLHQVRSLIL